MLLGGYEVKKKKSVIIIFSVFFLFLCGFVGFFELSQEAFCRCLSNADAFEMRSEKLIAIFRFSSLI